MARWFRRRFGIDNEQALDLFHQTVSMKSVGNLTDFVRSHMLEPFDVAPRIAALIAHFDDLNRAHEAVLKAQARRSSCCSRWWPTATAMPQLAAQVEELRACRDALRPSSPALSWRCWTSALAICSTRNWQRHDAQRAAPDERSERAAGSAGARTAGAPSPTTAATASSGWRRRSRARKQMRGRRAQRKAARYDELARSAGHAGRLHDADAFLAQRQRLRHWREAAARARGRAAERTDRSRRRRCAQGTQEHDELSAEIDSLKARRSNIPTPSRSRMRDALCAALGAGRATTCPSPAS